MSEIIIKKIVAKIASINISKNQNNAMHTFEDIYKEIEALWKRCMN